jgi:hypothetical protein
MRLLNLATIVTVLAIAIAAPALAGKGGNGNGNGGGNGGGDTTPSSATPASKSSAYSPTLDVLWPLGPATASTASMPYTITGCGYDSSYGNVTVVVYTPVSAAWTGASPDSGCISVSNFSTQGAGSYRIQAWQHVKNKDVVVASTSFTVA